MSFCLEKLKRGTQTLPNLPSEPDTEREPNSTSAAPLPAGLFLHATVRLSPRAVYTFVYDLRADDD